MTSSGNAAKWIVAVSRAITRLPVTTLVTAIAPTVLQGACSRRGHSYQRHGGPLCLYTYTNGSKKDNLAI